MTTDEAFEELLSSLYLWLQTGKTKAQRRWYRHQFKTGKLSEFKKSELLQKAGFSLINQPKWKHENLA